jgi:hypothetical protein
LKDQFPGIEVLLLLEVVYQPWQSLTNQRLNRCQHTDRGNLGCKDIATGTRFHIQDLKYEHDLGFDQPAAEHPVECVGVSAKIGAQRSGKIVD